ncbi:MAG: hypothetical protein GY940_33540 [bacterium]|nr:hypothetical protein [bacterium]
MKLKSIVLIMLMLLATAAIAGETPKPVLDDGDVLRFIKTFPLMKEDFEKYGAKYEAKSGNVTIPEALKASAEYQSIMKKYGWDQGFFTKMLTIVRGYSGIVYGKEMKNADPKIEQAIKQIKENAHLSDEMKKKMIDGMMAAKGVLKNQGLNIMGGIHPKDLARIKPLVNQIKMVLEKDKKKEK